MRSVTVRLESSIPTSFRTTMAANSQDIDVGKKSVHELHVEIDLETDYRVGLIVGASGSGKTSLARDLFGADALRDETILERPIIDQFPAAWNYEQCQEALIGIGLGSVPCWIRPAFTLSTGQLARAQAALRLSKVEQTEADNPDTNPPIVMDEWTSVVDRTVAKVMSHAAQRYARRVAKRIVFCSCHYDVIEWLNPDWIIDCNRAAFVDRRSLWRDFQRSEHLDFSVREVDKSTWRYFSKYHYLSERLPAGKIYTYGLFHGADQIGFNCFANYMPTKATMRRMVWHSNRTVIHPDFTGFGLGIRLINATAAHVAALGHIVRGKFSSMPVYRSMAKDPHWKLIVDRTQIGRTPRAATMGKQTGFRENVRTYTFEYIGERHADHTHATTA